MTSSPPFPIQWQQRLRDEDPEVLSWYAASPGALAEHAMRRAARMPRPLTPSEFEEWLQWLAPHAPQPAVTENVRKLTVPGTLAVVTGQQVGLFGGPLMVLYKAYAAVKLARAMESATGHVTVPIFWAASDDHDFAEVAVHHWMAADGSLRSWRAREEPAERGVPLFARSLPREQLRAFLRDFLESTPETDFRGDIEAFLRAQIENTEATWESQFVATLIKYLGASGLVPIAPRLAWMRRRALPVIRREVELGTESSRRMIDTGEKLKSLGAQGAVIHRRGNEASFFLDSKGVRAKVIWEEERALALHPTDGVALGEYSRPDLLELLNDAPEAFSPNAALRPIVQDAALPTVAYVGGPAEVLYHAQIGPLYELFDVFRPAVVPRPSAVLIEGRLRRLADKLGLQLEDALRDGPDGVRQAALRRADPQGLRRQVDEQLLKLQSSLETLTSLVDEQTGDTGLRQAAAKISGGMEKGTEKFLQRLDDFLFRRHQELSGQASRMIEALWPDGTPQERIHGLLSPLLRNHGLQSPVAVGEALDPHASGTQLLDLTSITDPTK